MSPWPTVGTGLQERLKLRHSPGGIQAVGVLADLAQGLLNLVQGLIKSGTLATGTISTHGDTVRRTVLTAAQKTAAIELTRNTGCSSLLDPFPASNMEGWAFAGGAQLDAPAATVSRRPAALALHLAPAAHKTGGHLAMLPILLDLRDVERSVTCNLDCGIHRCAEVARVFCPCACASARVLARLGVCN